MAEVADALHDAKLAIQAAEKATRKSLRNADQGFGASALRADPVVKTRRPLDDALARLERARHNVLLSIFAVALDDGMTIGELGRNYGFSRQLAARYAKEARARRGS